MLTKRTMLGAGALALALMVTACSGDRAGGVAGVDEVPAVPQAVAPPPVAVATPPTPEGIVSGGDGGGGTSKVIATSYADGHQIVLTEVTTSGGAKSKRVTFDGVMMADFTEATMGDSPIAVTAYADGQVFLQDGLNLDDASSIVIPPQYLGLTAPTSGGPQLQAALPCAHELYLFGGASVWVSTALMWARAQPYSLAAWADLRLAVAALGVAAWDLAVCLQAAW